jgi:hypothetical protein
VKFTKPNGFNTWNTNLQKNYQNVKQYVIFLEFSVLIISTHFFGFAFSMMVNYVIQLDLLFKRFKIKFNNSLQNENTIFVYIFSGLSLSECFSFILISLCACSFP